MNFEVALRLLKAGHTVKLKSWPHGLYLAMKNKKIRLFDSGRDSDWKSIDFTTQILSHQWEVIEPMRFYDQGFKDGHEAGWDEALARYLKALDDYQNAIPTHENSRSIITNLQENKDIP